MGIFSSFTQLILASVLVINLLLAFLVYKSDNKSATNIIFVLLSLTTSLWLVAIRKAGIPSTPALVLWYTRFTVFLAVPQSVLFFLLAHTLPNKNILLKRHLYKLLIFATLFMMAATLSPLIFKDVIIQGNTIRSIPGIGIPFFALFTSFFSLGTIVILFKKTKNSTGEVKSQSTIMMRGILLMLGLIISTIMIPVIFFQNQTFIAFSPLYALIFFGMTAYAVVKNHLFNLKVIATEAFAFILLTIIFSEMVVAPTIAEKFLNFFIFVITAIFSGLLIQSVKREVKQREELEVLSKELAGANVKLKALDQARAEFITIASHQLRTPPATIKWYLSAALAGDYGKIPDDVAPVIEKAAITNNHLISLIEDMLNVSRIERGKMEFLFEQTNTEELAHFAYEQLIPMAQNKKLELTYIAPKKALPLIMADKEKLKQVMNNMIDNSIKYTKKGTVKVSLEQIGNEIKFQVEDTGKGISLEDSKAIFEKYSRGKESVKQSAGLGLGLYVAKIIVEQHKGKIWAESKGEGLGSKFCFSLPINSGLKETTLVDLSNPTGEKLF